MLKTMGAFTTLATVTVACVGDYKVTVTSLLTIATIRGTVFLVTKVLKALPSETGQIVDFTGWCVCGMAMINILKSVGLALQPLIG